MADPAGPDAGDRRVPARPPDAGPRRVRDRQQPARLQRAGVRFRPRLVDAGGRTARFADGSSLDVAVVVWATGYRPDYSWIDIPGVLRDGRVAHRRGVTDVPGLYFLGLSWQHTRGSALLGFVADDAAHVVRAARSSHRDAAPIARAIAHPVRHWTAEHGRRPPCPATRRSSRSRSIPA